MPKAVVIYSGGMDSFTVLNHVIEQGDDVSALSFNYGQRHSKELKYAAKVCKALNISHKVVDITAINELMSGSSLTDDINIPEGDYSEQNMLSTVVPNRNMILISLATAYAVTIEASTVYYGAHSGDHEIYPDCRPEFVEKISELTQIANYQSVRVSSPYLHLSKADILAEGIRMGLDYSQTWTCYNGREKACGKCGSCVERLEAFASHQRQDPLAYELSRTS